MVAALIITVWVLGAVAGQRIVGQWMGVGEALQRHAYSEPDWAVFFLGCFMSTLVAAAAWPIVLAVRGLGIVFRKAVPQGHNTALAVRAYYTQDRDTRKMIKAGSDGW